jgi:hypothetical protein
MRDALLPAAKPVVQLRRALMPKRAKKRQADWSAKLTSSLVLKDGTKLVTLADARGALLIRYFERGIESAAVAQAIERLLTAAETGSFTDREAATDQVEIVLRWPQCIEPSGLKLIQAGPLALFAPGDSPPSRSKESTTRGLESPDVAQALRSVDHRVANRELEVIGKPSVGIASTTMGERDTRPGAPRRRRLIKRETPQRGFFGWLFLLIFLAFNAFMVVFLVVYRNLLGGMSPTTTEWERAGHTIGSIFGTGAILFFWVSGAVITGLLVLLTRALPDPPP